MISPDLAIGHSSYSNKWFVYVLEVKIDYWTYTENAIQKTIGREPEVQIVFTACFDYCLCFSFVVSLIQSKI